jgi:hypothetical protein
VSNHYLSACMLWQSSKVYGMGDEGSIPGEGKGVFCTAAVRRNCSVKCLGLHALAFFQLQLPLFLALC